MAQITVPEAHKADVARMVHLAEFFAAERARLEAELRYVMQAGQRAHAEVMSFLQRAYGLDAANIPGLQIDGDRGIITVPDNAPPADPAPAPAANTVDADPDPAPEPPTTTTTTTTTEPSAE